MGLHATVASPTPPMGDLRIGVFRASRNTDNFMDYRRSRLVFPDRSLVPADLDTGLHYERSNIVQAEIRQASLRTDPTRWCVYGFGDLLSRLFGT